MKMRNKGEFYWSNRSHIKNLIRLIENREVKVTSDITNVKSEDFFIIYDLIIENFVDLGKSDDTYFESRGTDGNPILTYKCTGDGFIYYIVGKLNHNTHNEDVHIFYNDGSTFNIMKLQHLCGEDSDSDTIKELIKACRER